jgi:serine/threonine-protein kinase
METARWQQIKSLFQETFERPAEEQSAFLQAACAGDAELRRAVQRLLHAHARASGFLDASPVLDHGGSPPAPPDGSEAGEAALPLRIGPYRVTRELGRGGMGTVYLAEREEPGLRKTVAIKVVRVEMGSDLVLRRFRTERQILAALEHPGIARLYDGGSEGGLPYFVMEYVDGQDLLSYCDVHGLSIAERLRLFVRVCEAVQYAHQGFVIHRDLKPSNILVTAAGEPKLLDFGIAKLVTPHGTDEGFEETRTVARLLTPQYASPEQLRGERMTTASDVYSLGVILYQLLCGRLPYRFKTRSPAEIERAISEAEPKAPSTAAMRTDTSAKDGASGTAAAEAVSANRQSTPRKLRRLLHGDLDNIALKALRKEPGERYATAAELSADVRRHLEGFPVQARPARRAYRAMKFVRRHRAGVSAATFALLSLVVGLGIAVWQARVARAERDRAEAEAAKAQEIARFLGGVFQGANPLQARGQTITARDLLDRGTSSIATELKGQPDIQASLLLIMAEAYEGLGASDRALELAQQSLALREHALVPASVDLAESLYWVGRLQRPRRPAAAVPVLERALRMREALLGPDHRDVGLTLCELALALRATGRSAGTRAMIERAVAIGERAARGTATLALLYNFLAIVLHEEGDVPEARRAYERSIAAFDAVGSDTQVWGVVRPLLNLGTLLREEEDLAGATPLLERALAIDDRWAGRESRGSAWALARLGDLARAKGDLPRARDLLEESLRLYAKTAPPDHLDIAAPSSYFGNLILSEGRPKDALPHLERALRIREQTYGSEHPRVAESLVDVAKARAESEGPAAAEPLLRRALAIQRRLLAPRHRSLVPTLTALGRTLARRGEGMEARSLLEEAVAIAQATLPDRHSQRRLAETALAEIQTAATPYRASTPGSIHRR